MINKEIILYWAERLESGDYKQVKGRLRNGNLFDCLGVLCDLGQNGRWDGNYYISALGGSGHGTILPNNIRNYVGLSTTDQGILMGMNDNGKTFKQIAAWLRRRFL